MGKESNLVLAFVVMAIVVVLAGTLSINGEKETTRGHVYRFGLFNNDEFKYYVVEGDVYSGNEFLGTTKRGMLVSAKCYNKKIVFKPKINFEYEVEYNNNCYERIHDFSLEYHEKIISELNVADKIISYIIFDNDLIRENAIEITKNCNDKACMANAVFSTIKNQVAYVDDPRDTEHIQTVAKTLSYKAGDCEDMTILLSSYLENIGIKSVLVLTNNHVYVLACGLEEEDVSNYVEKGKEFSWYEIKNQKCFILDPTVKNGYMGYSPNILGEKIAVDPVTKEYYKLNAQNI